MIQESTLRVGVDSRGAVAGAAAAERAIERVGNQAVVTEQKLGVLTGGARALGAGLAVIGAGVAAGGMFKQLSDFEQSLATVRAVTNATEDQMASLRAEAARLGGTTRFSSSEAADAMVFLGQAGLKTSQILEVVPGVLSLAQAGGLDLANASDIAAKTLAGFGLEVSDMARVVDVLAFAAGNASTDVQGIAEGMKYVAPVAKGFGLSLEQTSAALAVLSNAGLNGSMAGTGLRKVLTSMANPTKQAQAALARYGVTVDQINPSTVALTDAMQVLADKGVPITEIMTIFGDRGGPAAEVLKAMVGDLKNFTDAVDGAAGTGARMAGIMDDNLAGSTANLQSALESVIIAMGDAGLTGALRSTMASASQGFVFLSQNAEAVMAVSLALVARGIYPMVAAFTAQSLSSLTASGSLVAYARSAYTAAAASTAIATNAALPFFMYQVAGAAGAAAVGIGRLAASLLSLAFGPTGIIIALSAAFFFMTKNANDARAATQSLSRGLDTLASLKVSDEIQASANRMQDLKNFTRDADGALVTLTENQKDSTAVMKTQNEIIAVQAELRKRALMDELNAALVANNEMLAAERKRLRVQQQYNDGTRGGLGGALMVQSTAPIEEEIKDLERYQRLLTNGIQNIKAGYLELASETVTVPTIVDEDIVPILEDATSALDDFMKTARETIVVRGIQNELEQQIAENMFAAGLDYTTQRLTAEGQAVAYVTEEMYRLQKASDERDEAERKRKRDADKTIKDYAAYVSEIQNEISALSLLEDQRTAKLATDRMIADLKRSDIVLTADQIAQYTDLVLLQQREADVARERQSIFDSLNVGYQEYNNQVLALNSLLSQSNISQSQFNLKLREAQSALLQFKLEAGNATYAESFIGALDRMSSSANNTTLQLSNTFEGFFSTLRDGFADSVAASIVNAESFGDAVMAVARGAMQELISSLISMGINMLINRAIGQAVAASALATSVAEAGALAAAWAPAAALASLATLGTNAVPAAAGIVSTTALAKAMALIPGFSEGGWTGNGPKTGIAGVVHGKEFVVKEGPAQRNRALLESINAGATPGGGARGSRVAPVSASSGGVIIGDVHITLKDGAQADAQGRQAAKAFVDTVVPLIDSRLAYHKRQGGMLN